MNAGFRALACALAVGWMGCGGARTAPAKAQAGAHGARWDALGERFLAMYFAHDPGFAAQQGKHDHDGEIVDLSASAIAEWVRALSALRAEAQAFAGKLDPARELEREHLLALLDGELFDKDRLREHERSPLPYANALDPSVYLTRDYAPLSQRLSAYVRHLSGVPRVIDAMLRNLRTPLPRTFVEVGVQMFGGLARYVEHDVPPLFAAVQDARQQGELAQASALALTALTRATSWLEAQRARANDEHALGPALFAELLWASERIDTPLERLRELAEEDLARNRAALEAACAPLAPGAPLSACTALVSDDKPSQGPVEAARAQVRELAQFVRARQLVTIPSAQPARVEQAPPHKRWNQAFIEIPGPYEVGSPSVYYIAPPDPSWSEEERRGYLPGRFDLLFITAHEVFPGHFLQFLHTNRSPRPLGRVFVGYAFAEGWAHYAEELVWEAGLGAGDPKVHVGQLLNALLRDVRFVSALGLHTSGMTVAESERLFREQALQDAANARQQAARGTFDPGYLHYTLGKLMIRKLRQDWTATRGGAQAQRAFHDAFLSHGGAPIPLLRQHMLGRRDAAL